MNALILRALVDPALSGLHEPRRNIARRAARRRTRGYGVWKQRETDCRQLFGWHNAFIDVLSWGRRRKRLANVRRWAMGDCCVNGLGKCHVGMQCDLVPRQITLRLLTMRLRGGNRPTLCFFLQPCRNSRSVRGRGGGGGDGSHRLQNRLQRSKWNSMMIVVEGLF